VTTQSIKIGNFNKDEFGPGNPFTIGNFPGFQMGVMYRIYIEYYDASGATLNGGLGAELMTYFATPMKKASPPLVRECARACYFCIAAFFAHLLICSSAELCPV
jgi:hypothetical protein